MTADAQALRRGQIHWASLDPVIGSEQAGRRPVIIVSNNDLVEGPTVVVVPISSRIPKRFAAFHVHLPQASTGLPRDSVALCHHLLSVSRMRLIRPVGHDVREAEMHAIGRAMRYALDVEDVA